MRAFVCTDYGSVIRKLVWLNESRAGVYVGMYDKAANPHASYHADGTHHMKIVHRGTEVTSFQEQKLPICSIPTYHSILGHGAFYEDSTMSQLPEFRTTPKETAFVLISHAIFRHIGALAMNMFIVNRTHELEFLSQMYARYQDDTFDLVTVSIFRLEHFPSHNLSVVLYRGKKGRQEADQPSEGGEK